MVTIELIGFLLPILISVINKKIKDSDLRFWVSVVICALVGAGLNYIQTLFVFPTLLDGFNSVTQSIMVVFGLAQLSYGAIFKEDSTLKQIIGK